MALTRWLRLAARAKALDGSGLRPADRRVDLPRRAERAAVLPADLLQKQHVSAGWQLPGTWENPALTAARHAHRAVLTAAIHHGKEAVPIAYLLISSTPGTGQLLFASTDPEVAEARGVPVGRLGLLFLLELALTVTGAAQSSAPRSCSVWPSPRPPPPSACRPDRSSSPRCPSSSPWSRPTAACQPRSRQHQGERLHHQYQLRHLPRRPPGRSPAAGPPPATPSNRPGPACRAGICGYVPGSGDASTASATPLGGGATASNLRPDRGSAPDKAGP